MINSDLFLNIVLPHNILTTIEEKRPFAHDASLGLPKSIPHLVIKVETQVQLIAVVKTCLKHKTCVVIRGAGTGRTGGAIASEQSVLIDVSALNRIVIDTDNMLAIVEPGVIVSDLQQAALEEGLYYPVDPASQNISTIGGNVAENAAGPSTVKYGTTKDYVLGGTAIIGTGEVIEFGKSCVKGVCGYDIASILCGSEGTLAVFTKLIVRLLPKPLGLASALCSFAHEEEALVACGYLFNHGFRPKALEYIDSLSMQALCHLKKNLIAPSMPALIIECDGYSQESAQHELNAILKLVKPMSLMSSCFFTREEQRHLWNMRAVISEACSHYLGHKLSEDIAVPLGKLLALHQEIKKLSRPQHLEIALFGHAGDGNLHVQVMFSDESLQKEAFSLCQVLLHKVLALGGTIAAEHGIGLKKKSALPLEQSDALIALQKRLKLAFDPHNLLNPGKIFDV